MHIGHINLDTCDHGIDEHFVRLIEALQHNDVQQYVLVRSAALLNRLRILPRVTIGPVVRSSVTAACLMPRVDLVHTHDALARQAGLILNLTRSIPFILTGEAAPENPTNPITQSIHRRAAGIVSARDSDVGEHLLAYRQAMDSLRVPTLLL